MLGSIWWRTCLKDSESLLMEDNVCAKQAMAAEEQIGFNIGQRVCTINTERSPQCGTVKYVGSVQGYEGSWVGVDWDSGQGKHNGTVKGIHYFDTSGEQSGSLVRPNNLSGGVSVLEALSLRYKAAQSTDPQRGTKTPGTSVLHIIYRHFQTGARNLEGPHLFLKDRLVATPGWYTRQKKKKLYFSMESPITSWCDRSLYP